MNTIDATDLLAQIVIDHPACAKLFAENKIDFCCHGDVTLADACASRGLDVERLLARARTVTSSASKVAEPITNDASTPDLVAYLVSSHHAYLRRALPALEPLVAKVARVHGARNPKLANLLAEVRELRAELESHLDAEESEFFPMLVSRDANGDRIARLVTDARQEHERIGRALGRIRALSDDFCVPGWACRTYRMMMSELASLEEDTLRHVHIENHVLMPRFDAAAVKEAHHG